MSRHAVESGSVFVLHFALQQPTTPRIVLRERSPWHPVGWYVEVERSPNFGGGTPLAELFIERLPGRIFENESKQDEPQVAVDRLAPWGVLQRLLANGRLERG